MLTIYDHRTAQYCSFADACGKIVGRTVSTILEASVVGFALGIGAWSAMKLLGIYQVSLVVAK